MNKRTEAYLPKAFEAIEKLKIVKDDTIPKPFNGYISSFGASIRQAGLLATVLFYSKKNNEDGQIGPEEDRYKIVDAIEMIIGKTILTSESTVRTAIRAEVEDAAIALKLCIRTFELVKG